MKALLRLVAILLLVLGPYIFATSPLPPPYHQFHVSGKLVRPNGGAKQNFAVVLLGKSVSSLGEYEILRGLGKQNDRPAALTDSGGGYFLVTSAEFKPDSIAVAVVVPDRPIALGQSVSPAVLQSVPHSSTFTYIENPESCNGCRTEREASTIEFYTFMLTDQDVTIPW